MRFWFGFLLGAAAALAFAYRKQLLSLWENKAAVSAGERAISGAQTAIGGVRELWDHVTGDGQ